MQQKIIFTSGMDSDTSPELIGEGKARKRINVRVLSSDNEENGSQETPLGNTLVSYTLPSGTNIVIGSAEDVKQSKIYYFIYNDTLLHRILEYDYITNTIALVLAEAATAPYYLNFSSDFLITGVNVIELDENNHLLYWTDNYVNPLDENDYNEPKKLNIEKAKHFSAGDYVNGYPNPFEPRFITRIKQPCATSPTSSWSTTSSQKVNYLFQKLFQFKVQFVYDDYEISAWSPISKYAFPVSASTTNTNENYLEQSNTLNIRVATGSGIVKRIRIAAKQLSPTISEFSLIADLNKENLAIGDDTFYTYSFFNDGNYVQLLTQESSKLFDWIPQRSKSQEIIDGIRIVDGDITENFDPVNIDMRLPLSVVEFTPPTNTHFVDRSYLKAGGIYKHQIVYYDEFGNRSGLANYTPGKSTVLNNDRYGNDVFVPFLTDPLYTAPHGTPNLDMSYVPELGAEIYHSPPSWAKRFQITRSKNESMGRYVQFIANRVRYVNLLAVDVAPSVATYCLIYLGNIVNRYVVENAGSQLVYDYAKGDRIRFIANIDWTTIPAGAVGPWTEPYVAPYYTPVGNTVIDTFFTFNDSQIAEWNAGTQVVSIAINPSSPTIPLNLYAGCLFEIYQPAGQVLNDNELVYEIAEEGTIGNDAHGNLVHQSTTSQLINSFTSATHTGASPDIITAAVSVGHGLVVTNKVKITTSSYSGYGTITTSSALSVVITLLTGTTLHGTFNGALAGTIVKAATLTFDNGDCFRRKCNMPATLNQPSGIDVVRLDMYIETSSASNFFPSNAADYGRPNSIDPEIKRVNRPSSIYYSELFIAETGINGLSSVYDKNFETYDQRHGSIQKLRYKDIGLVMMQELKLSLVPVNRILTSDLQLNGSIGTSNAVLSSQPSPYAGDIGIGKNPESHAFFDNSDYGVDVNRGAIWRLSNDGITIISDTGNMHNYVTDRFKALKVSGVQPKIYGVFDRKFNEYIVAISEIVRAPELYIAPSTLAWSESENFWSTFYEYFPEGMCTANTGIVTFLDGALYTHNDNTVYNNFYGIQRYSEFWVICNGNSSDVKILNAISEESNATWEVTEISTPNGQLSSLIVGDFEEKENNQYASVLRDANTPNIVLPALPIFEGDVMRDRTFLVKFKYPGVNYNKINAVNFYYKPSDMSNRN